MRVILEITSGPGAGRKTLLGANQALLVGRTEQADFSVPQDGRISARHFALEADSSACYVRDLGSTNGTLLNGSTLTQRVALHTGDLIKAGDSSFSVDIEGEEPREIAMPCDRHVPGLEVMPMTEAAAAAVPRREVEFSVETCSSGLTLCRGIVAQIAPAEVAVLLSRMFPAHLIVDVHKFPSPPEDMPPPDYLFDWLDGDGAEMASPVVVSQEDLLTWPELLTAGWGNDAVVCLFSGQEKVALRAHLAEMVRVRGKRPDQGGAILGYCWPSVMSMLLAHNTPGFANRLLEGIDAVLVELADLPETWQVYGQRQIADLLCRFGFVQQAGATS